MASDFEEWAEACEIHLRKITDRIAVVCSATRQIRSDAMRYDAEKEGRISASKKHFVGANDSVLEYLGSSVFRDRLLTYIAGSHTQDKSQLTASMTEKEFENLALRISEIADQSETLFGGASQAASPSAARNRKLVQKHARYFSSLASVFQLQDCLEQRIEHVSAACSEIASSDEECHPLMMQILSAQVAGIGKSTLEFASEANEAAENLAMIYSLELSTAAESHQTSKLALTEVAEIVRLILQDTSSQGSTLEEEQVSADVANFGAAGCNRSNAWQELIEPVEEFDKAISSLISNLEKEYSGDVQKYPVSINKNIEIIESNIESIKSIAGENKEPHAENPEFTEVSESALEQSEKLFSSFTMDLERADFNSVMKKISPHP